MSDNQPIITRYRPQTFDEMIGHESAIAALKKAMAEDTCPHSYLLTGPAGTGKTTTARIIAQDLNAEVLEIDAASNNGVDDMRRVVDLGQHMALSGAGRRFVIIDECHTLSKPAWQALLKTLEEPPEHLYFALCTTEADKVPDTIKTRCYPVAYRPLKIAEIGDLIELVCDAEKWELAPGIFDAIVQASTGQPRKALTILNAAHDATDKSELSRIVSLIDGSEPLIELAQCLMKSNPTWQQVAPILARIEEADFENGVAMVGRYIAAAMQRARSESEARNCFNLLEALIFPSVTFDRKIQLMAAVGRTVFGGSG